MRAVTRVELPTEELLDLAAAAAAGEGELARDSVRLPLRAEVRINGDCAATCPTDGAVSIRAGEADVRQIFFVDCGVMLPVASTEPGVDLRRHR